MRPSASCVSRRACCDASASSRSRPRSRLQRRDQLCHALRAAPRCSARASASLRSSLGQRRGDVGRRQRRRAHCVARSRCATRPAQLVVQLLEARALGLRGWTRRRAATVEGFPALLPAAHARPRPRRAPAPRACSAARAGSRPGPELRQRRCELGGQLRASRTRCSVGLLHALRDLRRVPGAGGARISRACVDRLLGARDLGADLVVAALHLGQHRSPARRARCRARLDRRPRASAARPAPPAARGRARCRIAWRAPRPLSISRRRSASSSACSCRSSCFSAW